MTFIRHPDSYPPKVFGYVYVVHPVGHNIFKIGRSLDPKTRFIRLEQGKKYKLEVITIIPYEDYIWLECALHRKFNHCCFRGEWFLLEEDDLEFLRQLGLWLTQKIK